jgi:catechol 2,3-dioxygenase-like lactoylglutathione lyase family enzyme
MRPTALDHVALWVADRDRLSDFLCAHLGMHVIEQSDAFTLVGPDARLGKLTLFAADGPREPGVLERVVLRVGDPERALRALPAGLDVDRTDGLARFDAPEGLRMGLVASRSGDTDYDIDHVVLRVPDPSRTSAELAGLGFASDGRPTPATTFSPRGARLTVADKAVELQGAPSTGSASHAERERPLLNHLALLVDSAEEHLAEARRRGLEIADVVDAPNTYAVFVWGPDRIKLEYVEHKPGFALT